MIGARANRELPRRAGPVQKKKVLWGVQVSDQHLLQHLFWRRRERERMTGSEEAFQDGALLSEKRAVSPWTAS
jgi:hypothetical protein